MSTHFTFDGVEYSGERGDTLAAALLRNSVLNTAPSLYRKRPRGIVTAGVDEPNALVRVERDGYAAPMLLATTVGLCDGLVATSVAGLGALDPRPDPDVYDKMNLHADVVVVGGGPAGIAAAEAAARSGARTVLIDDQHEIELPDVQVLGRTTVLCYLDHNYLIAAGARRLWHIRAKQVVLATGAHERPLVFAGNDVPGVMSAAAVRTYLDRYGVTVGQRVVVATTADSAYLTALELAKAGTAVPLLVDARPEPPAELRQAAADAGIEVLAGSAVIGTRADSRISGVRISALTDDDQLTGPIREEPCDLLAVCGGWDPAVQLWSQSRGTLRYDETLAAFLPDRPAQNTLIVGAARGVYDHAGCVQDGFAAGREAAARAGFPTRISEVPDVVGDPEPAPPRAVWLIPGETGTWDEHFVDLQRDTTVADLQRAIGAGMRSIEHIKRYTTAGTAHDQGKHSGVATIGVIAKLLGAAHPGEVGTTTYRGPYIPASFALLAGRERGPLFDPVRTTSIHPWHVAHGAVMENVGQWHRPRYYPKPGEDMETAVLRECRAARTGVAVMDASTLGKIDVIGPDAGVFLDRLYTNGFSKLAVSMARYGVMCHADGMVFDDGVVLRLAEDHYYATTTTGNAATVLDWMEEWLQTEWPELRVYCTSVTEQWSTVAVVGPGSRAVVGRIAPDLDVSNEAFPFMAVRHTTVLGGRVPARVCRISFSGELAYELNVEAWYGLALWEAVIAAGEPDGITPYGTETMHVLRAEKGYPIVGQDTDGTVTPVDLGMDWIVAKHKDFVGKRSLSRPDTSRPDRRHLVGLLPLDPAELLPEGAQLVDSLERLKQLPAPLLGHVTSSYRSAALDSGFALALVAGGRERLGQTVFAPLPDGRTIAATVVSPVLYDPEGTRRDG